MFFKGIPLFSGLSDAEHGLLLQVAVRKNYPRNSLMIQQATLVKAFISCAVGAPRCT